MNLTNSLIDYLVIEHPSLRPQIYFKSSLLALTRAMEDLALASDEKLLIVANFQHERFFRPQEHRYFRITQKTDQVYVLAVPDTDSGFALINSAYETIPLSTADTLAREKHLIIFGQQFTACLVGQEKLSLQKSREICSPVEQGRRFEGFWTFDRKITRSAAEWLLERIHNYRPELAQKIEQARQLYVSNKRVYVTSFFPTNQSANISIFTQRLVTYLQASQYKLLKAYKTISSAERKEYLINKIAQAQRYSLNPQEILKITVRELGQIFPQCRCILYRVNTDDTEVIIEHEFSPPQMTSLFGQPWSVANNPIFIVAQTQDSALIINDVADNVYLQGNSILKEKIERAAIHSWLIVPIRYQKKLLGVLELHSSKTEQFQRQSENVALVEAVANSAGVAVTQAIAFTNLAELNLQLEAVERIQNNLVAVVGHELRTPLSTIRICLESLAGEPEMPDELRDSMLDMALSDSARLGQLIQDFLTLSKLEAGKTYCDIEPLTIDYAINLAIHRIQSNSQSQSIPEIQVKLPKQLPPVLSDGEGLIEVFTKLLDNACKFTPTDGKILITADIQGTPEAMDLPLSCLMLEIVIADTGRGIEKDQLDTIFDRFSQSERYLRRTAGGIGLGLAICRKIIQSMGGQIWAQSAGENQGSQFHFTLPLESQCTTDFDLEFKPLLPRAI